MTVKTLYFLPDTLASGSTAQASLQDGGSAPSTASATAGWIVGNAVAGNSSPFKKGVKQIAASFGASANPVATIDDTNGNAFRSQNSFFGTFANTNWSFAFKLISTGVAATAQQDAIRVRVFKSSDSTGQSGLTELTSGGVQGSTVTGNTSTEQTSTVTWTPSGTFTLNSEYLFVSVSIIVVVSASGGGTSSSDWVLRTGSAAAITTPDFVLSAAIVEAATATDTGSASSNPSAASAEPATAASTQSVVFPIAIVDGANAARIS